MSLPSTAISGGKEKKNANPLPIPIFIEYHSHHEIISQKAGSNIKLNWEAHRRKDKLWDFSLKWRFLFSLLRTTNISLSILVTTDLCGSETLHQAFSRDNRRPSQKSRLLCAREVLLQWVGERKSVSLQNQDTKHQPQPVSSREQTRIVEVAGQHEKPPRFCLKKAYTNIAGRVGQDSAPRKTACYHGGRKLLSITASVR